MNSKRKSVNYEKVQDSVSELNGLKMQSGVITYGGGTITFTANYAVLIGYRSVSCIYGFTINEVTKLIESSVVNATADGNTFTVTCNHESRNMNYFLFMA